MSAGRILLAGAIMLPFLFNAQTKAATKLVLAVKTLNEKTTNIVPGSRWYVAELINKGTATAKLEAIQMSGEYAGTGQFFNCSLEVWKRGWHQLWSDSGPAPKYVEVALKPGDHKKVCIMLLPSQAGSLGQYVRFKLTTRWHARISHYTVSSEPFVIGEQSASSGPCRYGGNSIPMKH